APELECIEIAASSDCPASAQELRTVENVIRDSARDTGNQPAIGTRRCGAPSTKRNCTLADEVVTTTFLTSAFGVAKASSVRIVRFRTFPVGTARAASLRLISAYPPRSARTAVETRLLCLESSSHPHAATSPSGRRSST